MRGARSGPSRRETIAFAATLAGLLVLFFAPATLFGRALSPVDVLGAMPGFSDNPAEFEPSNDLLIDPVLQFEPWLAFTRSELRRGRLPLWNPHAGMGAPHLANGQAAVFDPFHVIAYLGTLPAAHAWIAVARLATTGVGMFLLAGAWGLRRPGRWFCGLCWPFCGFLIGWLLYPPAGVAVWLPWAVLAAHRVAERRAWRSVGMLGLVGALACSGGHVQTTAHVFLIAGAYALWRRAWWRGGLGLCLGAIAGAVAWLPLASYLRESPVWADRRAETPPPRQIGPVRAGEAVCTAFPYVYGSQRRGHPNLARALGFENVNESAGGYVGLASLVALAPLGWSSRRRVAAAWFLGPLAVIGALAAFGVPPVINLLRALPVLDVIDHRRLTLAVAFGLCGLAGIGFDQLARVRRRGPPGWLLGFGVIAGMALIAAGVALGLSGPRIEALALERLDDAARAARQRAGVVGFLSVYHVLCGLHLVALMLLFRGVHRGRVKLRWGRGLLAASTAADLIGFGVGANPTADPAWFDRSSPPAMIRELGRRLGPGARAIGTGDALLPNLAMRWGLADARNYDSVESARALRWLEPIFEPSPRGRNSRRDVTIDRVMAARDRLIEAGVGGVVIGSREAASIGSATIPLGSGVALLPLLAAPRIEWSGDRLLSVRSEPGRIEAEVDGAGGGRLVVREVFHPGWRATVDGVEVDMTRHLGTFLAVDVPAGRRSVALRYDPPEIRVALAWTAAGLAVCLALMVLGRENRPRGV